MTYVEFRRKERYTVMLMRLQNRSGVVLLRPFTLLMERIIIKQRIMVRQQQQTSHLVFLVEN